MHVVLECAQRCRSEEGTLVVRGLVDVVARKYSHVKVHQWERHRSDGQNNPFDEVGLRLKRFCAHVAAHATRAHLVQ